MKENQRILSDNCNDLIGLSCGNDVHTEHDTHRNRLEKRTVTTYNNNNRLIEDAQWQEYVSTVIRVERQVSVLDTRTRQYEDRSETSIYITNFILSAKEAARFIRNHWHIENKNHYVRDVSLKEDLSRIRVDPQNMSTIRSFALNVLRRNKVKNVSQALYENSLDYYRLYSYQQFI